MSERSFDLALIPPPPGCSTRACQSWKDRMSCGRHFKLKGKRRAHPAPKGKCLSLFLAHSPSPLHLVRSPGYLGLLVSSRDNCSRPCYTFSSGRGTNPCPLEKAGLKGVVIFRDQRGIIPGCSWNALCVMWMHRARSGGGNGAKRCLAIRQDIGLPS